MFSLSGCRQTDFLKDIVHAAWAEVFDENTVIRVNNPDAEKTDEHLPAYDLEDVATTTDEKQNIVVYSSNPNTVLVTTRHSVFDLSPRFTGVEASDAVRLVYADNDEALDHAVEVDSSLMLEAESETDGESPEASEEERTASGAQEAEPVDDEPEEDEKSDDGKTQGASDGKSKSGNGSDSDGDDGGWSDVGGGSGKGTGTGDEGDQASGGQGEDSQGEGGTGDTGDDGQGDTFDEEDDGRSARESGGYDGSDITYDPGNRLDEPEPSDHVAAIGQAAIVAQAVGGKGALVAMDEYTYYGLDSRGNDDTYASCFRDVFADELDDGFESSALLWSGDGTVPGDVTSTEKLVAACSDAETGEGGTIVFCSNEGSQADFFSSKQLQSFKAAGIQLLPIDLSTPQGTIDAFVALGEVFADSDEVSEDAMANAEQFRTLFNNLMNAATHARKRSGDDGTVAVAFEGSTTVYGDYLEGSYGTRFCDVWASVADGFEPYAKYSGDKGLDASGGLLFSTSSISAGSSPLSLFMQASGVVHLKASKEGEGLGSTTALISPLGGLSKNDFSGYSATGPLSHMEDAGLMDAGHWSIGDNVQTGSDSVGSALMPYLIVTSGPDATGAEVKNAIVGQQDAMRSIYYLEEAGGSHRTMSDILAVELTTDDGGTVELNSALGCQHDYAGSVFRDKGVNFEDCIRVNPCGLMGAWTGCTPEAVLETAWLVDLYSRYPENSDYQGCVVNDVSKYNVAIGAINCSSTQQAVEAFYASVYRCDLSSLSGVSYADVVPDSGEGLNLG